MVLLLKYMINKIQLCMYVDTLRVVVTDWIAIKMKTANSQYSECRMVQFKVVFKFKACRGKFTQLSIDVNTTQQQTTD